MGISSFIDLCKPKIVLLLTITALVGDVAYYRILFKRT